MTNGCTVVEDEQAGAAGGHRLDRGVMRPAWSEQLIARTLARQTFEKKNLVIVPNCNWTGNECDLPVTVIRPLARGSAPASAHSSSVRPAPTRPAMPRISPACTEKLVLKTRPVTEISSADRTSGP